MASQAFSTVPVAEGWACPTVSPSPHTPASGPIASYIRRGYARRQRESSVLMCCQSNPAQCRRHGHYYGSTSTEIEPDLARRYEDAEFVEYCDISHTRPSRNSTHAARVEPSPYIDLTAPPSPLSIDRTKRVPIAQARTRLAASSPFGANTQSIALWLSDFEACAASIHRGGRC
jgi:hypothetical protein